MGTSALPEIGRIEPSSATRSQDEPPVFVAEMPRCPPTVLCGNCGQLEGAAGRKLLRCTGCKTARYCDTDCQRQGWAFHKAVCGSGRSRKEAADTAAVVSNADADADADADTAGSSLVLACSEGRGG